MVDLGQKKVNTCLPFFIPQIQGMASLIVKTAIIKKSSVVITEDFLNESIESLFILFVTRSNLIPVDDIKKCIDIIGSAILIIQIVSMFPNIQS